MSRTYQAIDADGHVLEPGDLWLRELGTKYKAQAPRVEIDKDGKERFLVEGKMFGHATFGLGTAGTAGIPLEIARQMKYAEGCKGGFDPHARIAALDLDGIDLAVLYPTLGLFSGAITDPGLAAAVCRVYNIWLADYCKAHSDRLIGMAMLPMQSVEHAVEEMKYARGKLNFRGGFLRPNPYNNRLLSDPIYDRIWGEAQELDFALAFHEGTGGMPSAAVDRVGSYGAKHIASHQMEMQLASLNIIWSGVCERFPKVRFGFLECSGGWVVPWLDRMDRHFDRKGLFVSDLKMRPSEYFRRQCWISFEPCEGTIAYSAEVLGPSKLLWATDYPHPDAFFPGAPRMIADKLPKDIQRQVLAQGAIDFYGLQ